MQHKQENAFSGEITVEEALKDKALLSKAVTRYNVIQTYLLTPEGQLGETRACLTNLLIDAMDRMDESDSIGTTEVQNVLKLFHLLNEVG